MTSSYIAVVVAMTRIQFAVLAKKAASKGVYLAYANGEVRIPVKIGRDLAMAYANRIRAVDAELAA